MALQYPITLIKPSTKFFNQCVKHKWIKYDLKGTANHVLLQDASCHSPIAMCNLLWQPLDTQGPMISLMSKPSKEKYNVGIHKRTQQGAFS